MVFAGRLTNRWGSQAHSTLPCYAHHIAVINYKDVSIYHIGGGVSMSSNLEVLEAEILQLPSVERSHLLERLNASLDSDPEVKEAWEREADRREAELESGSISAVSGQDAIARLRAKLTR